MPRPKGSKNKIKKEPTIRISIPIRFIDNIKIYVIKLLGGKK